MADRIEPMRWTDALCLAGALALFVATGLGFRDPWPADEPRFALVARDMVLSGDWLFPRVGGDFYSDKPPVYFWLLAAAYSVTGSIRASFLVPSFLAAGGVLWLVFDMSRRLTGRAAGLAAAGLLACTVQFVVVMRGAQIDPTLCLLTTLSLYAFLRHLLLGPAWGWYFIGGLASGLGVVTKGVGFLPLLLLLPYPFLRARGFAPMPRFTGGARWLLAAAGFLLGVAVWLVPMLWIVSSSADPELIAYRDGILFQQTVERYAAAWHHVKPWYYFLVEVIPALWLPASLLLVWLVPRWKEALVARDARPALLLAWIALVLLFFSASAGKRGVYVLPALPALAIAAAPFLPVLFARRSVRYASLALGGLLVVPAVVLALLDLGGHEIVGRKLASVGFDPGRSIRSFAVAGSLVWLAAWRWRAILAWPAVLGCLALVWSYDVTPRIDAQRSGRGFLERALALVPAGRELALAGAKEQFFLYLDRPVVNFGHKRWMEKQREAEDAARWLNAAPGRTLLLPDAMLEPCFRSAPRRSVGVTSREPWSLVELPAQEECASRGDARRAIRYSPTPLSRIRTEP
jgi:4-amino-4-deoxy-L-arabinose transferase-like glycosyltransferase